MIELDEKLRNVTLDEKYTLESGTVLINGTQCLARLPLLQRQLDFKSGLNTAGFISGYRGSPIGNLDQTLWHISEKLKANNIVFQPGVNEDLAATAIAGSQQISSVPDPVCDGVFAMWYGKGPGVDRSMDAFKHGNYAGVQPHGGVLVVYGDDHPGKSSTVAHQSEQALAAQLIPSLYPSSAREFLQFGLLGWAMSRYSGSWVGLKCVNETIEQTVTCAIDSESFKPKLPTPAHMPEAGVHYRGNLSDRILNEQIAYEHRLNRVQEFVRANNLDHVSVHSDKAVLGIVSAGKSHNDVLQALEQLGINPENADLHRVSVYKVACIWPLEPVKVLAFTEGLQELLVVEEKKPFLEQQLASLLVNRKERPLLSGKFDPDGLRLLSSTAQLTPNQVALAIAARLEALNLADDSIRGRAVELQLLDSEVISDSDIRSPFFCSGCPHNRSTKIPQGSLAMAGTGCATMEVFFRPERIVPTQMGGEGANWIGLSPFVATPHIFQNMGDGTYFHSGLMSIRAAVSAKVNITFKILYNDAVAMTGGQPIDGPISVDTVAQQVLSEGVRRCIVVTDDESNYQDGKNLPPGVDVFHRDELDAVQRDLRKTEGCTVLIYEQTCAAEKRRRRKRGKFPDPAKRMFIYESVCEGCGDCSVQANCVSIQPHETALGLKRKIDQYSCNKDYSCALGFCPSFVTIYNGVPKKKASMPIADSWFEELPIPGVAACDGTSYNVMIAGIGGTGVVTIGAILGMAAHLERLACSVFDMTGLAQKNGAVYSHLKVASRNRNITTSAISASAADLILGFDLIASLGLECFQTADKRQTHFVGNSRIEPLAKFQLDPDALPDSDGTVSKIEQRIDPENIHLINATGFAIDLCGDSMASNMFLLGYAAQLGLLPVSLVGIRRAIDMNGVAVELSHKAFDLGRLAAHDPQRLQSVAGQLTSGSVETLATLDEIVAHRCALLSEYQDAAYAQRYRETVAKVVEVEQSRAPGCNGLAEAVAKAYSKLLAYKDEYEIARLYSSPRFLKQLENEFEGDLRIAFNLAPPLISKIDPRTGRPAKREFGAWMLPLFHLLARMRRLRGTPFDIFGYAKERRLERRLIRDYELQLEAILSSLTKANHHSAVELASLPEKIRGFGLVKRRNIDAVAERGRQLANEFQAV